MSRKQKVIQIYLQEAQSGTDISIINSDGRRIAAGNVEKTFEQTQMLIEKRIDGLVFGILRRG